jgi:hypothetical protein
MKAVQKYTLNDFDLLVAKASFLFEKRRELEKDQQKIIEDITQLLVDNHLDRLTTSCGQSVKLQKTFEPRVSSLSPFQKEDLYKWCKERDLVSINHARLLTYLNEGKEAPPINLTAGSLRAKFISHHKPVSVSVNVFRETEKSVQNTTPEKRNAHMKDLRAAGLTFAQIAKIYRMSSTHVARILKKKDDIQKIRNGSVVVEI